MKNPFQKIRQPHLVSSTLILLVDKFLVGTVLVLAPFLRKLDRVHTRLIDFDQLYLPHSSYRLCKIVSALYQSLFH